MKSRTYQEGGKEDFELMMAPQVDNPRLTTFDDSSSSVSSSGRMSSSKSLPLNDIIRNDELDDPDVVHFEKMDQKFKIEMGDTSRDVDSENIEVGALLANQLNKLSFHERERINDEIHGVGVDKRYIEESGVIKETPQLLTKSFRELNEELNTLRSTKGGEGGSASAFNRSQELFGSTPEKGTYLNESSVRLMFLRSECFDCKKAAERLCKWADLMSQLYGDVGLERRIKLSDFDDEYMEVLKWGRCQFFGRDRAGRLVYAHFSNPSWVKVSVKIRIAIPLFILWDIMENDVVSQKRGIVTLWWMHTSTVSSTSFRGNISSLILSAFPFRPGAIHMLFPSSNWIRIKRVGQLMTTFHNFALPKVRIHYGSSIECNYALQSFGISSPRILTVAAGTNDLDLTNYNRWLALVAAREKDPKAYNGVIYFPTHSDILFGRGQIVMNHPGNIMFRNYIQSKLFEYSNTASKKEATQWTWGVVRTLKSDYGARFLKEEKINDEITAWVEVSNEIARSKVRIAFRDARTRLTKTAEKKQKNKKNRDDIGNSILFNETFSGNEFSSQPSMIQSSTMAMSLSQEKELEDITPLPLQSQQDQFRANFEEFNYNIMSLNQNLTQLNNNLNSLNNTHPLIDSSTSAFLSLDGGNNPKRQRMCSNFFDHCKF